MSYDLLIIGSGAGGVAAAYHLTQCGQRVLLLEKGGALPKDGRTLDVDKVVKRKLFVDDDPWLEKDGHTVVPQERSNLGGKTKWYGAALLRFAPEEFAADAAPQYLPWPFACDELEPFYAEAERLLGVRHFPIEPDFQRIVSGLRGGDAQWRKQPLPVGLAPDILDHADEAKHFDAFASPRGLKSDAENRLLARVRDKPNLDILTNKKVVALRAHAADPRRVSGVQCEDGSQYAGDVVLLAGGALHSPRLLQTYCEKQGLADKLPGHALIGRNYTYHLLTAMLMLTWKPQTDVLRKTTVLLHNAFPHSSVQPLGWLDGELLAPELRGLVPCWLANVVGKRAYGLFLQTEDGSHPDNRVVAKADGSGLPLLDYDARRLPPARRAPRPGAAAAAAVVAHRLRRTGDADPDHRHGARLRHAGDRQRPLGFGRRRQRQGARFRQPLRRRRQRLATFQPGQHPALTIYAWALRVASRISGRASASWDVRHG